MSKRIRFRGVVRTGHKGAAVEVPFDPSEVWGVAAVPLWKGRRGYPVQGELNGVAFESAIVSRARRFFLLIDAAVGVRAKAAAGDVVEVGVWSHSGTGEANK